MSYHTPVKPIQGFLEKLKTEYTYDRENGCVINNKRGLPTKAINSNGYRTMCLYVKGLGSKMVSTHHVVWFFEYGEWPTSCMDHIDGDKLNNHYTNLRLVTSRENTQAYNVNRKTSSPYHGVSCSKSDPKWRAQMRINGVVTYLGSFTCELEAARVYDRALVKLGLSPLNVNIMREQEEVAAE